MKGLAAIVAGLVVTLLFAPTLAGAQSAPIGKRGEVEFHGVTRVGTATLQPGLYRFQHKLVDGQHVVVVESRGAMGHGGQHAGAGAKGEVARVACKVVPLTGKARQTLVNLTKAADGTWVITQMRIRDEQTEHVLALEPAT